MDLIKSQEFFNPREVVNKPIHIIGCGAVGSHLAEQLVRLGCTNLHLWDFDKVDSHNIANQMFINQDIGELKVTCVERYVKAIDPNVTIIPHGKLVKPYTVQGYIFLCVDSIELRKEIVLANQRNPFVEAFFDFRIRLIDGQHVHADRTNLEQMKYLLSTMDFTDAEAKIAAPKTACGTDLSVCYTVKTTVAIGVSNFVKFVMGKPTKQFVSINLDSLFIMSIPE